MNIFEKYNDINIEYSISGDEYSIYINKELKATQKYPEFPYMGSDIEESCINHIDIICSEIKRNEPTQEEIQAEILLNQAEILSNQSSQDEVLAELLLNSLEVSTNV